MGELFIEEKMQAEFSFASSVVPYSTIMCVCGWGWGWEGVGVITGSTAMYA